MRKAKFIPAAVLCLAFFLCCSLLGGCAANNAGNVTQEDDPHSAVVKKAFRSRTVQFPDWYFEGQSAEEVIALLTESGCSEVEANEDGTYSATMPLSEYKDMVNAAKKSTAESLDAMVRSERSPDVSNVKYEGDFSSIKISMDVASLPVEEMFIGWTAGLAACHYQALAGQPVSCHVVVTGSDGTVLTDETYPAAWEEL